MFIVDFHTLGAVHQLDLIDQVTLKITDAADLKKFLRHDGTHGQFLTFTDPVAATDHKMLVHGNVVMFITPL